MSGGEVALAVIAPALDASIRIFNRAREAQRTVQERPKVLEDISIELDVLVPTLTTIRNIEEIKTPSVINQVKVLTEVGQDLLEHFKEIQTKSLKSKSKQTVKQFFTGEDDKQPLARIYERLLSAKSSLQLMISSVHVGLERDHNNNLLVSIRTVEETNERVHQMLGIQLALQERLRDRPQDQDGFVPLNDDDAKDLGLNIEGVDKTSTTIIDNVTLGQAQIIAGDIGVQKWQNKAKRATETRIAKNWLLGNTQIISGDMSAEAFQSTNQTGQHQHIILGLLLGLIFVFLSRY